MTLEVMSLPSGYELRLLVDTSTGTKERNDISIGSSSSTGTTKNVFSVFKCGGKAIFLFSNNHRTSTDLATSTSNFVKCVLQGYLKEDCFHAPMREAGKGTTGAHSRAQHVRVRSPVSRFLARNSYSYVQHCFHAVSAK